MYERSSDEPPEDDDEEIKVPPIVEQVRKEMGDAWRQDEELLDKFFPVEPTSGNSSYQKAWKKLYNDKKRYKRWKGISATPESPSTLYTPLVTLLNGILFHYGISKEDRLFLNTHLTTRKAVKAGVDVSPGIFLVGTGPEFATTWAEVPRDDFESGISAFEVALDSEDLDARRDLLAVHMTRIFQHQVNRRFAYGLIITQSMFTVYMFDHSGAVASPSCNYHEHPDRFCAVISGLASAKERIGFDNSMFSDEHRTKIRTSEPGSGGSAKETEYVIKKGIFRFSALVGRGTKCWLTSRTDDPQSAFVIKDAWIAPPELSGRESEGLLLLHAKSKEVFTGVAQIHHFEDVQIGLCGSDPDTVLHNRRLKGISADERKLDRVHTRIVMATHGKTLDKFSTPRELVLAFHDAVCAHRKLHEIAGILHRDISVRNILINPEGEEGDRGVLIDFDHAIRIDNTSPYSTQKKIGTWRYMSRNVLRERGPHTYLDDLESFFYVLCWVLVAYEKPGVGRAELPGTISLWDDPASYLMKTGLLASQFKLQISPWFGQSLHALAVSLHGFFEVREPLVGAPLSDLDPTKDYDEFLSHISQSVVDLEQEIGRLSTPGNGNATTDPSSGPTSRKRDPESSAPVGGDIDFPLTQTGYQPTSKRKTMPQPPLKRPRRKNVDYGDPHGESKK